MPVYISNEDYRDNGSAPVDERAELQRIFQEGYARKLSVGTVHAYVLGPDGHLLDSLHTAEAAKPPRLIAMLERAIATLKTPPGAPVVAPSPPTPPACPVGSVRVLLTARYLELKGDHYALIQTDSGDWSALPSTDWICIPRAEWASLMPSHASRISWELPAPLVERLAVHFYPPTENNDLGKNRLETAEMRAAFVGQSGRIATVRIDGRIRMQHDFYHKPDGKYVDATVVGYATIDVKTKAVRSLNLVTDRADYFDAAGKSSMPFGVAVRLAP